MKRHQRALTLLLEGVVVYHAQAEAVQRLAGLADAAAQLEGHLAHHDRCCREEEGKREARRRPPQRLSGHLQNTCAIISRYPDTREAAVPRAGPVQHRVAHINLTAEVEVTVNWSSVALPRTACKLQAARDDGRA